jgi:hypothetical protein
MSIQRVPHTMGASSLPHQLYRNRRAKFPQLKTYEHPAGPPHNGLASSPHQLFVTTGPLQGQQLPACVHVIAAENIGDNTWVTNIRHPTVYILMLLQLSSLVIQSIHCMTFISSLCVTLNVNSLLLHFY